jgi:ankyrin repeat protein
VDGKIPLAAGASVNEPGPQGMTPLVLTSASGQRLASADNGADPNARDNSGATALHLPSCEGSPRRPGSIAITSSTCSADLHGLLSAAAHKADPNIPIRKRVALGGRRSDDPIGATACSRQRFRRRDALRRRGANPRPRPERPDCFDGRRRRGRGRFTDVEKRSPRASLALELGVPI